MIMAWWKGAPQSLPSYTFGGMFRECQDVVIARKVARICQQSHQVIPVGKEFLSRFAHYAEQAVFLSDGCAGVNRAADLYANEIAAEIAPVRMTGNYGSEILRRLRAFKPGRPSAGLFQPEFLSQVDAAKETFSRQIRGARFIIYRLQAGAVVSIRSAGAGTNPAHAAFSVSRQRSGPYRVPRAQFLDFEERYF